jgi:general stress protein YciG
MSGTKEGAAKARTKLLANNPNYFKEIGKLGGKKRAESGELLKVNFASNRERAIAAGRKGGSISRRGAITK